MVGNRSRTSRAQQQAGNAGVHHTQDHFGSQRGSADPVAGWRFEQTRYRDRQEGIRCGIRHTGGLLDHGARCGGGGDLGRNRRWWVHLNCRIGGADRRFQYAAVCGGTVSTNGVVKTSPTACSQPNGNLLFDSLAPGYMLTDDNGVATVRLPQAQTDLPARIRGHPGRF